MLASEKTAIERLSGADVTQTFERMFKRKPALPYPEHPHRKYRSGKAVTMSNVGKKISPEFWAHTSERVSSVENR